MKQSRVVLRLAFAMLAITSWAGSASAQVALPTASRTLEISAFGGLSGVYTGLAHGKNLSFTAGGDLGFLPYHGVRPSLEVRGTLPMYHGRVASEKDILGGLKVGFLLNHSLRPYADILFGRGEIKYQSGGYVFGNSIYLLTTTNVISPGAGFDYDVSDNLSLKVDGQWQHWGYAPTSSGAIYSKVGTLGVVYRFNFGPRSRR